MKETTTRPTGWLLTVEPLGNTITWSLMRNDGRTELVGVGQLRDTTELQQVARRVTPSTSAAAQDGGWSGLWASLLTDPHTERSSMRQLGSALLPEELRGALAVTRSVPDLVTVATRGWLVGVPWELMSVDESGDVRLIERARVVAGLSPVILGTRRATAVARHSSEPGCAVVDPGPVAGSVRSLYPAGVPRRLLDGLTVAEDAGDGLLVDMTRDWLSYRLHQQPSRLFYLGHIRVPPREAQSGAALVLRGPSPDAATFLTAREWLAEPARWPAPPRVALIGCASNDSGAYEQTGLVVAAVNAGAHVVTATKWPLPTDHPSTQKPTIVAPVNQESLTDLAVAVHRAYTSPDVVAALRDWQLTELAQWRATGHPAHSPLFWAAPVTYLATPSR